jgi:hypothetical protein
MKRQTIKNLEDLLFNLLRDFITDYQDGGTMSEIVDGMSETETD